MLRKITHIFYIIILLLIIHSCNTSNSLNKELQQMSNDLNKDCPIVVNKYTTLTSTVVIDKSFMYIYKVEQGLLDKLGMSKSDWKENQTQNIRNIYCTDSDMLWFRIKKVPVIWSYEYIDGTHIGKIEITPDDCN